jgi:hypothetical protein
MYIRGNLFQLNTIMKKLLISILFTVSLVDIQAQKSDSAAIDPHTKQRAEALRMMLQNNNERQTATQFIYSFDTRYEGFKGNYYFNPEWLVGDLYGTAGKIIDRNIPLKYDAYNKEVLMKKPNGDTLAVFPMGFTLYDDAYGKSYTFMKYAQATSKTGVSLPDNFLLIMFKGKNMLMKDVSKRIVKADYQGAYSANRPYDTFDDNSEYYIIKNNGDISKLKLKKGSLLDALNEHKVKIEEYLKTNNINIKNDGDLVKVMAFYDSL